MHSTACTLLTCMPKWDVKMNQTIKADDVPGMIERCMRHGEWNLVGWAIQPGNHCLAAWTIKKPKPKKIKRAILKWVGMSPRLEQKEATCLGLTVGTRQLLVLWRGGLGFALFFSFFFYTVYVQDCRLLPLWETRRFPKKQGNTIPRLFSIQIGAEANGRFLTFWCPPGSRISKISAPTHSLLTLPVPSAPLDNQSYKPNKLTRQQGRWYSPKRATGKLSNISGFPLISKSHSMFTSLTTGWYKRIHNHTPKPEKNKGVHESETKMAWVWFYCFVQTFFHSKNQNQT